MATKHQDEIPAQYSPHDYIDIPHKATFTVTIWPSVLHQISNCISTSIPSHFPTLHHQMNILNPLIY